jgi:hypothetical protein
MEENNEVKMNPEDLKLLIEQNEYLKYVLKIMNDIPLDDETEVDYQELWNKVSLTKNIDPGEVNSDAIYFYYMLLSTGLDNFGEGFIRHMSNTANEPYLAYAIKCLLAAMTQYEENSNSDN